jgi:hypothetical protein
MDGILKEVKAIVKNWKTLANNTDYKNNHYCPTVNWKLFT